jgi:3-hydroxybutyryl-CoA dehydratase
MAPVRIGDTITAQVEILDIMSAKNRVRLKTDCVNQEGTVVINGEALVSPPKAK